MIETILKDYYARGLGVNPNDVAIPLVTYHAPFTLSDAKACNRCHQLHPNRHDCNEQVLKVDNQGYTIDVVSFEQFVAQFKGIPHTDRCDWMMADHNDTAKIVFCDLTCSEEKYVNPNSGKYKDGKRAKARQQMIRSIEQLMDDVKLCNAPLIQVNLLIYREKVCLFAWRDYDVPNRPPQRGDVASNMQAFSRTPSMMASQLCNYYTTHHQQVEHQFEFMQIKYPTAYRW